MYKIFFHPDVKKDLKGLPQSHLKAIKNAIDERLTLRPYDFKALSGKAYHGLYRLRIAEYRIVYSIENDCVQVLAIGHRSKIYNFLEKRV